MIQWPGFQQLDETQYKKLLPPCWSDPGHLAVWMHCDQCKVEFQKQNGKGSIPSSWVCRCGKDMLWHHRGVPHVDDFCGTCREQMIADASKEAMQASKKVRDAMQGREEKDLTVYECLVQAEMSCSVGQICFCNRRSAPESVSDSASSV
jgi:hypothetical protein